MSDPVLDQNDGSFDYPIITAEGLELPSQFLLELFGSLTHLQSQRCFRIGLENIRNKQRNAYYVEYYPDKKQYPKLLISQVLSTFIHSKLDLAIRKILSDELLKFPENMNFISGKNEDRPRIRVYYASFITAGNRAQFVRFFRVILELWEKNVFADYIAQQKDALPPVYKCQKRTNPAKVLKTLNSWLEVYRPESTEYQSISSAAEVFKKLIE